MKEGAAGKAVRKRIGGALRALLVLLLVAGVAFVYEYQRSGGGVRTDGQIVERKPRADGGGPVGDRYEIVIEYQAGDDVRRFSTSRPVWDAWGKMNTIGARVAVLYRADGRAFVDSFAYLYPLTMTFLVLSAVMSIALMWMRGFGRPRLKTNIGRTDRFRQVRKRSRKPLSKHRKELLGRLNRWLIMVAGVIVLMVIGVVGRYIWLVAASIVAIVILQIRLKSILTCPHCGVSLKAELKDMVPHAGGKTNWLMVQNYLAKGVDISCQSCDRSLDD